MGGHDGRGTEHDDIDALAASLGRELGARGLSVTTAESCTGGLIAGAITSIAGSSGWFSEGYVTYADAAKRTLTGVPAETLEAHGAVSEPTVAAMARGALERSGADVAIAASGIAGPGGAVPGKPVGTVWLGVAVRAGQGAAGARGATVTSVRHRFDGDRAAVRRRAVAEGLRATLSALP